MGTTCSCNIYIYMCCSILRLSILIKLRISVLQNNLFGGWSNVISGKKWFPGKYKNHKKTICASWCKHVYGYSPTSRVKTIIHNFNNTVMPELYMQRYSHREMPFYDVVFEVYCSLVMQSPDNYILSVL